MYEKQCYKIGIYMLNYARIGWQGPSHAALLSLQ